MCSILFLFLFVSNVKIENNMPEEKRLNPDAPSAQIRRTVEEMEAEANMIRDSFN